MISNVAKFTVSLIRTTGLIALMIAGAKDHRALCSPVGADQPPAVRYRVRSVRIAGGWRPNVDLGIKPGSEYAQEELDQKIVAARDAVKRAWDAESDEGLRVSPTRTVSVILFTYDKTEVPRQGPDDGTHTVDIIIRPVGLRMAELRGGSNLVGLPFSISSTFLPRSIENFANSDIGLGTDRSYGLSSALAYTTPLTRSAAASSSPGSSARTGIDFAARGRKSLSEPFYNGEIDLGWAREGDTGLWKRVALTGGYDLSNRPLGAGKYLTNAGKIGGAASLNLRTPEAQILGLGLTFRWSDNRLYGAGPLSTKTTEGRLETWTVLDGHLLGSRNGFTRVGLWTDFGSPNSLPQTYQRVAAIIGYSNDIAVNLNQSIGLNLVFGVGNGWGNLPEYARFYGGNTGSNFLDDTIGAASLTEMPPGPMIRSFGAGQATSNVGGGQRRGGTSYWHVNLDVAVPVKAWSLPLIPNEAGIIDAGDTNTTLKQILKKDIDSGKTILISVLKRREGLTQEQAQAKADNIYREIRPMTNYIIDQANIYAVKPLLLFDAAGVDSPGASRNPVRAAFGAGLQLSIVTARFEIGYMHTIKGAPGDPSGNFFLRLGFKRFF